MVRHVMRREKTNALRVIIKMNVEGKKGRGRTKRRWFEIIVNDMRAVGVCVGDIENQDEWRFRVRVADHK
jgi:hypothetical protein